VENHVIDSHTARNRPLQDPFALAVIGVLDHADPNYPLEVISIIESTLDNPRPVLAQQQFSARGEAIGAMKAEGLDYDERMEALDDVEYPQPLAELLIAMFETFASTQPWIRDVELRPKSVVRDLYEKAMTFTEYVSHYKLARSEGLLLRYLSDADRAIRQTVPDEAKTEELRDIIEWLRELVRQVDSSLQDEWEMLSSPTADASGELALPPPPPDVTTNKRAFFVLVRNELFRRVQLAALQRDDDLQALDPDAGWPESLDAYYADHEELLTGGNARSASLIQIETAPIEGAQTDTRGTWAVRQVIDDPAGDHDWGIEAVVDLAASAAEGFAVVRVLGLRRL